MNKEYVIMNKNTFETVEDSNLIAIDSQLAKTISILNKKGYYVKLCSRARLSKPFLITDLIYNLQSKNLLIINEENKKIIDQLDYESTLIIFKKKYVFNNIPKNFKLIKIRVNNCFVNAKKEYLQTIKNLWKDFVDNLNDKSLLNLVVDCNVVAASDKIAILTNVIDGTSNLINNKLNEIETNFNNKYKASYKFIALTENKWNEEKKEYIANLKNKYEYQYIEEPKQENIEEKNIDNIEKIAYDIFDKEKIEIE